MKEHKFLKSILNFHYLFLRNTSNLELLIGSEATEFQEMLWIVMSSQRPDRFSLSTAIHTSNQEERVHKTADHVELKMEKTHNKDDHSFLRERFFKTRGQCIV